jgi:hypothetical protein
MSLRQVLAGVTHPANSHRQWLALRDRDRATPANIFDVNPERMAPPMKLPGDRLLKTVHGILQRLLKLSCYRGCMAVVPMRDRNCLTTPFPVVAVTPS